MNRKRQSMALVAASFAVALAVAGAAAAALLGRTAAATTAIKVTEREYHIALSTTAPKSGTISFVVHNAGHIAHQFDVSGGGLKAIAKTGPIAPGKTKTLTVKLGGGKVSVWCPVPGHAALGMKATLKVSGAAAAPAGAATTPGSTTDPYPGSTWG